MFMGLYGNIAVKVIYLNVIEDTFKGPRLMSFKGRFVWTGRQAGISIVSVIIDAYNQGS